MGFEGAFWMLWEDEPVNLQKTRFLEFANGIVFDARTGEQRGTYLSSAEGVEATFDERHGEREVVKIRMHPELRQYDIGSRHITPPFDGEAESFALTFSTVRFEQYVAGRPANDQGTDDEQNELSDREMDQFGIVPTFGCAYRDCLEVREMGERNEREYIARKRRETIAAV